MQREHSEIFEELVEVEGVGHNLAKVVVEGETEAAVAEQIVVAEDSTEEPCLSNLGHPAGDQWSQTVRKQSQVVHLSAQ